MPVLAAMQKFTGTAEMSENGIFPKQLTDIPIDFTADAG
jgi:hypothetical protein